MYFIFIFMNLNENFKNDRNRGKVMYLYDDVREPRNSVLFLLFDSRITDLVSYGRFTRSLRVTWKVFNIHKR